MTREQCKELLPAIKHFANGGNLWSYYGTNWIKQHHFGTPNNNSYGIRNIIEDKHFVTRKAYALGEEIECKPLACSWTKCRLPEWKNIYEYRPKPKEPVYEYQAYGFCQVNKNTCWITPSHMQEDEIEKLNLDKFEPSKRIRKC